DALLYSKNGAVCLIFDREAQTAKQAVETAMTQIRQAGFNDLVLQEKGYATLSEIAKRTGLSRAAVAQYASGKRERDFPRPMFITGDSALYSWCETAQWLYQHGKISLSNVEIATL
ncbi:MAG: TetR family transcriptional regulator, partial [Neisseriaceae bacterium]|nr:TetR family transcriptional regulator [Neisseriaceae bacterium]